jgi:Zn-dependent peptidase ImmA (M78 family)
LTDQEFEDEAALLLAEYGNQHGQVTAPPVPIDDIVEGYLKLAIEYRDLRADYPEGDVLGCIWFNDKIIAIDQSLVPEEYPAMLGRYRFTLAHELAHWRLHRHLYLHRANEQTLFPSGEARPDHVLRSRQSDPLEFQANRLASCLLMPREMVKRAWHAWRGGMDPIYLPDLRAEVGDFGTDEIILENAVRPLAGTFQVSAEAMRIRLEKFGLVARKKEASLFDSPISVNRKGVGYGKA